MPSKINPLLYLMTAGDKLHNTKLAVKQIRSTIGRPKDQRKVIQALGLRKLNSIRVHDDGPRIWGMIQKVIHLVQIERIRADDPLATEQMKQRQALEANTE